MKSIHLTKTVPESLTGQRLDQALARLFPEYSRSQLQTFIRSKQVSVDGEITTRQRDKVKLNQQIEINAQLEDRSEWSAQQIPLNIIFEDDSLLVINKPAGLVVHPGAGNPDQTLVNALLYYAPELKKIPRAGIVHRLDKNTSGLLVVARTLQAHHALVNALQQRYIEREYQAIVQGVMIAGGTVDAEIGRHPTHRIKMAVTSRGKPAITHYRVIERFQAHTHILVKLETGRTHQIRVHLAHIRYPIVGDPIYGRGFAIPSNLSEPLTQALGQFRRQALHACKLSFTHPATHKHCSWQVPLPDDMAELITLLKADKP